MRRIKPLHVPISTRVDPRLLEMVRLRAVQCAESFASIVARYLQQGVVGDEP